MRVYVRVLGTLNLQRGTTVVRASAFPGRQGRLAFTYLTAHRRPVARDELATAIWQDAPPNGWPRHLAAIVSKLRAVLAPVGLGGDDVLTAAFGTYELRLPADVEVDLHAAAANLEDAEAAIRTGDQGAALGAADTAANLARRPLLPAEDGDWLDRKRASLRHTLVRAIEIEIDVLRERGDLPEALRLAEEAVALEPFRESAHVHLMRVHLAAGNRAQGLRAYDRCRKLLAAELGVDPSSQTQATYQQLLETDA